MSRQLLILITFLLSRNVNAQHCGFDVCSAIVLYVHASDNKGVISNLKIQLLDSNYNAFKINYREAEFYQNSNKPLFEFSWLNKSKRNLIYNFPFANNNYISVRYWSLIDKSYWIKIEDIDGDANGGRFLTKMIKLDRNYFYKLCSIFWDKTYHTYIEENKNKYEPMEVILSLQ